MPWHLTHKTVRANVIDSKERIDKESRCKEKEGLTPILIGQKRRIGELGFLLGSTYVESMLKTLVKSKNNKKSKIIIIIINKHRNEALLKLRQPHP